MYKYPPKYLLIKEEDGQITHRAGFCPHWSAVVGSDHLLAIFTTNYSNINMGKSLFRLQ